MHIVASPGSHGALEGGGLSVRSFCDCKCVECVVYAALHTNKKNKLLSQKKNVRYTVWSIDEMRAGCPAPRIRGCHQSSYHPRAPLFPRFPLTSTTDKRTTGCCHPPTVSRDTRRSRKPYPPFALRPPNRTPPLFPHWGPNEAPNPGPQLLIVPLSPPPAAQRETVSAHGECAESQTEDSARAPSC